jgi:hypothetical protein
MIAPQVGLTKLDDRTRRQSALGNPPPFELAGIEREPGELCEGQDPDFGGRSLQPCLNVDRQRPADDAPVTLQSRIRPPTTPQPRSCAPSVNTGATPADAITAGLPWR